MSEVSKTTRVTAHCTGTLQLWEQQREEIGLQMSSEIW